MKKVFVWSFLVTRFLLQIVLFVDSAALVMYYGEYFGLFHDSSPWALAVLLSTTCGQLLIFAYELSGNLLLLSFYRLKEFYTNVKLLSST
jgi:hypothetical protein